MLPGKKYKPEDFVAIAWRRKWVILVPFVLLAASAVVVSRRLPDLYRSEAKMVVVPQRVPDSYVRSVVSQPGPPQRIEDRVLALRQQCQPRPPQAIILEFDLYPDLQQAPPGTSSRMRSNTGRWCDAVTRSSWVSRPDLAAGRWPSALPAIQ
jgi:hypothetical protein